MTERHNDRPEASSQATGQVILDVRDLGVHYLTDRGPVQACSGIDFTLRRGEILGLCGESGSGKSTLLAAITRLQRPPAVIAGGSVRFTPSNGQEVDLCQLTDKQLRPLRWQELAIVMQSAMDCLNPVMRLGKQFTDVLRAHDPSLTKDGAVARTADLLRMVGIAPDRAGSYPHELSGGMRQRSLIALSLACDPSLVVMDEPTTAVDVVMQRQILSQVLALQRKLQFAVIFVTHDLSLLFELADRIGVMYAGRLVELGSTEDLYQRPRHPYTKRLRKAFPPLHGPRPSQMTGIPGTPPDLRVVQPGCPFEPRCDEAVDECRERLPELIQLGQQQVACVHYEDDATTSAAVATESRRAG